MRVRWPVAVSLLVLAACSRDPTPAPDLRTVAEQSGYQRTGRYDEVIRLCAAYAQTWPDQVTCTEFGRSPEGRPLLALIASRSGVRTASDARTRGVPVLLMQGGIHAGEIDGKDAGFLALRELLRGEAAYVDAGLQARPARALESIVIVFVPVFNVDGHERFGRWNRPNQTGPEESGWRATAQNLNLNRDYTKADAPEMQAMLRLLQKWDPILYVDLHATNGAQFEHDLSNTLEPVHVGDPQLQPVGRAILAELNTRLRAAGSLPLDFYPEFFKTDDPSSGFAAVASPARFSTGYWPLHNRFALLVETHSWKDYPTRVRITRNTIVAAAEMMAAQGRQWREHAVAADARTQQLAGQDVAIDYQTGPQTTTIDFRGYAYTRQPSPISGGIAVRYDPSKPEIWRVPFYDTVLPRTVVKAPAGGYVIPLVHAAWMADKLGLHGILFERIATPVTGQLETFRADTVTFSTQSFEGHTTATVTGSWKPEQRSIPVGSLFVPLAQPRSRLVMTLLEPQSPDSFAAWGFFNTAFERKEYMESYVAEDVAVEMLKDPAVAAEFRRKLAEDKAFAANPQARLDFFYRRHPSFDERLNLYPIYRVAAKP